ncbi:MAG: recombinase family protein [bacterium]|nr:recombinase family protein [bacterium]
MSQHPKISAEHLSRAAYIYIRQSTLHQVSEHQESQALQYQLSQRAEELGWHPDQIVVIDEDLGKSGISSRERYGFQRLYTAVGLGEVGLILVTNVSRLARNCGDWYQLLDSAAANEALVSDSDGVYNPTIYADRLLLGIQGAFSEAQWYQMRQQMQAARLNKAKRGELGLRLPVGYERLPDGSVQKTADGQVQQAIAFIFESFPRQGSVRGVLREMRRLGLQMPRQGWDVLGQPVITWQKASYQAIYQVLKLPAYAGAYSYGKRQVMGQPGSGQKRWQWQPPEAWLVLLKEAHPGYISWDEYMDNQAKMAANWQQTRFANPNDERNRGVHNQPFSDKVGPAGFGSAAGKGQALLQGLVVCARCGRPLRVRYRDKPAYVCEADQNQFDEPRCQFFPYAHVDQVVVAAFLAALEPASVELALAATEQIQQQGQALAQQWQHQLERARYEVSVAQARYEQVDPALRLVAVELERQWEEKLQKLADLQAQWEAIQADAIIELSSTQLEQIRQLTTDLPALWASPKTTLPERKQLLRTLVAAVSLDSTRQAGVTHLELRWHTGAVTQLTATRPTPGHPTNPALLARVRDLAQTKTDADLATILNAEGLVSSWHVKDRPDYVIGQPVDYWTAARVRHLRAKHHLPTGMPVKAKDDQPRADGLLPAQAAARHLKVAPGTMLDWFRRGFISGSQAKPGSAVWVKLDNENRHRFDGSVRQPTATMVTLAQAPAHFGLTPTQLTAALRQQTLFAWRVGLALQWFISTHPAISAPAADL